MARTTILFLCLLGPSCGEGPAPVAAAPSQQVAPSSSSAAPGADQAGAPAIDTRELERSESLGDGLVRVLHARGSGPVAARGDLLTIHLELASLPPEPEVTDDEPEGAVEVDSDAEEHEDEAQATDAELGTDGAEHLDEDATVEPASSEPRVHISTWRSGVPMKLTLGARMVVTGLERGLVGMRAGDEFELDVPPELGYGERGAAGIPAHAPLHVRVRVVSVESVR